jgi:NAD+ synthase
LSPERPSAKPPLLRDRDRLTALLDDRVERLAAVVRAAGRERAAVGLSGGIDSAVALGLAVRALGPQAVVGVRMPSRHTEQVHLDDAAAVAEACRLPAENLLTISIEPLLDGLERVRGLDAAAAPMRFGNASARCRMIVLYDVAQAREALVVGTENRSEFLLGYYTRFGDAASDLEPIADLYKTEVRTAAGILGLPEPVIEKHPTAGLWGGQTDEDELGFAYADADVVMAAIVDRGLDPQEAAALTGVDPDVVARVRARMEAVAWKATVPHVL